MFTRDLIEFGLGEKEAKIYISLLELEIAGVQDIAKHANINRSSAYVSLESLRKKGLVSISDEKKVRQYIATPPEVILRAAEDKAQHQENVRKKIQSIVPEMKALYKGTKRKPIIKVFEGKDGLISAFEDTLCSSEKIIRVSSAVGNLARILPNYLPEYVRRRFDLGIKMHGIHPYDKVFKKISEQSPKKFDTPIGIPENKYKLEADLAIYDNKIAYMSPRNGGLAIVIESKDISDVMKNLFDLAFQEAKKLKVNKE